MDVICELIGAVIEKLAGGMLLETPLPGSVRGVQKAWEQNSGNLEVVLVLGVILIMAGLIGVQACLSWKRQRRSRVPEKMNDPEKLFIGLLDQLELSEADKQLLREMTDGARLRHPASCLLSPAMLDWSRQLWREEVGSGKVTQDKFSRIDEISVALYDHKPAKTGRKPEA
ncbi:MAG: hypothetical protein JXD22_16405 [Sedimentisphaerales bacterium]|nr:hypothetical protein [Sedimentisphaerales bacterium]